MWENAFTKANFPSVVMGAIGDTCEGFKCQKTALEKDVYICIGNINMEYIISNEIYMLIYNICIHKIIYIILYLISCCWA